MKQNVLYGYIENCIPPVFIFQIEISFLWLLTLVTASVRYMAHEMKLQRPKQTWVKGH